MIHIDMYADLSCPFAYVVHARWRKLRKNYPRIAIRHKCLALEYVNRTPNPKSTLDVELPVLLLNEPDIPYEPWSAPASEWPVTIWPAFEAVKCAERQSLALADDLAWAIRVAFFSAGRCISMRDVLIDLAQRASLDVPLFELDFDAGTCKSLVIQEARAGWEQLKVPGSPSWVLPDGAVVSDFGLPEIDLDERGRPVLHGQPGEISEQQFARMRAVLDGLVQR